MNKIKILFILMIQSVCSFAQIDFENGYFIDNEGAKIDCFIKNMDWLKNPTSFTYKIEENSENKEADINTIKEFSISNKSKYIRAEVNIDTSLSNLGKLSNEKAPLWLKKTVFLKVLVEGKANLYFYRNNSIERFFFSKDSIDITQLVFKEYYYNKEQIAENNTFHQQLYGSIRCPQTSIDDVTRISYSKKELIKYFENYNLCINPTSINAISSNNKAEYNFAILTGLNYSSLSISKYQKSYINTNFKKKIEPTLSVNFECILPFSNYKWAIECNPTFQIYQDEYQSEFGYVKVDLKSIDLAVGVRYYLFINKSSKFFFDCDLNSLLTYNFDSRISYKVNTSQTLSNLDIKRYKVNVAFGVGFEFRRAFCAIRYYTNQDIMLFYPSFSSNYSKTSFVVGYKIFKNKV